MRNLRPNRLLACATFFAAALQAQTHRVEAPEKVIRSVAVYEWTGDLAKPTAARLIPVSLFIDGKFQEGGTYYARPVPLALWSGNIYSLDKAGIPQGTLTLDYARHLQSAAAVSDDTTDLGWFGYGTYANMPVPRKARALQASAAPPPILSSKDDDRPTFVRRNPDDSKTAGAPTTDPKTTGKTPAATTTPAPAAPDDDPDRPHFSKGPATTPAQAPSSTTPDPSKPGATTPTATTSKTDDSQTTTPPVKDPSDDSDRPTLRHRDPKQAEADRKARDRSSVSSMPNSLNDDPDRPTIRRGKTAGIGGDPAARLTGMPVGLHQVVAVSDPTDREPHPFAREWATPTERAEVLVKLEALARQQLAEYATLNGAPQPATQPHAAPKSASGARHTGLPRRASAVGPLEGPLTSEELTSYTLSYGGLPTFVYTAISTPAAPGANPAPPERYVTLVAQQLPSGEIQRALASVTDAAHLDRTPWFRLIDAVDPDAEHRASLLFELRGHTSRQFALYRILSAQAEPLFVTTSTD